MGDTKPETAAGPGDPGVDRLASMSRALEAAVSRRILAVRSGEAHDSQVRLFAEGLPAILDGLAMLEAATRYVVNNLQRSCAFDPSRRERLLNRRTRARKLQGHMILHPTEHLPLSAACHPDTWVAQVQGLGLAIDERLALFPGPYTGDGRPTAWLCSDPDLVAAFCELWHETKRSAVPVRDVPGLVRLTERQLDVVALLSKGAKDATISRLLGVSPRTVTSDVGKIMDAFGVATRWEAGMVIGRACPPSLSDRPVVRS
ncbi:helix-turn-helix transcriptional regulator [Micromonospora sp. CPCC 205711]|uniref:helix-turn-helix transcriptional regulator n=1 Tax=Micromonospora sp. CPCC 205547 TaxID=3122400 RepID=UPI002FF30A92